MSTITRKLMQILLIELSVVLVLQQTAHAAVAVNQAPTVKYEFPIEEFKELDSANSEKNPAQFEAPSVDGIRPFSHRDEDQSVQVVALDNRLKYDVEILEARDIMKENDDLEERFKGSAMKKNIDTFFPENIEMNIDDDDGDDADSASALVIESNHLILSIVLVIAAIVSIGLYAALVMWRMHLEQRYGNRELLVTNDDDYYFNTSNIGRAVGQTAA